MEYNDLDREISIITKVDEDRKKVAPRDIVLNTLSSILIVLVLAIANGFVDGEFKYEQMFSWNMGILVIINWVGGIALTYTMRQSAIQLGQATEHYINADRAMQKVFDSISDYSASQKKLDKCIEDDYLYRKKILEGNISKLVLHKNGGQEWKQGDPLPPKTGVKVKLLAKYLDKMQPPQISLIELGEKETSRVPKSLFDIPSDPTTTGASWFAKKGMSKLVFFSIGPVLLSLVAGAVTGGATFKSFFMVAGTLAMMLFNAIISFASSYKAVVEKGVSRLKRITRIIKLII